MKIIFMGTPEFALPSLKILIESHHEILAVVTAPDKKKGRGLQISSSPIKVFAEKSNIDVIQALDLKDNAFINLINKLQCDLIVVVAFRILPKEIFTLPKYGSINLHASLLPKYRGAAPINWALINGEKETGVTTFLLKEKVDTGSIILQKKYFINEEEDAGSLTQKLALLGAEVVLSTVNLIEMTNGNIQTFEQNEYLTSKAPKIFTKDCLINWNKSKNDIHNFIRGLSPQPGAFTYLNGRIIKILKTDLSLPSINIHTTNLEPSSLFKGGNNLYVKCLNSFLKILEIHPESKKKMNVSEFLSGYRIGTPEHFTSS